MTRKLTRYAFVTAAVVAALAWRGMDGSLAAAEVSVPVAEPDPVVAAPATAHAPGCQCGGAGCKQLGYGNPALFYNFYVPNNCGVPAQMYVAPRPVPPLVGHSYYTYQPLLPHEFMYPHYRTYRNYYDDGHGFTRTRAVWYSNPLTTILKDARQVFTIPR